MIRLAIISSHPIQYNAPIFASLAKEVDIHVFYTWSQKSHDTFDHNFGIDVSWDIPLLEGYTYSYVKNSARTPRNNGFWGIVCPSLIKEIEVWGATHILVFGWNYYAHLKAMKYFKNRIPVWFRGDSTLLDESPSLKTILRRFFLRRIYQYIDKAFYVGANNKNYFLKHGLTESQLIFAPHAIDIARFTNSNSNHYKEEAKQWRQELGINASDFVILFCGKFESKKNPLLLLSTFLMIKRSMRFPHLKLILTGSGKLEAKLKDLANNHEDIIFLSFQNQSKMPIVYRLANVFCLPSQGPGETWGLAVNEAMASGLPIIVSDKVGCAIDLVKNGRNGFIFKNNRGNELEFTIKSMLEMDLSLMCEHSLKDIKKWSFNEIINVILKELNR